MQSIAESVYYDDQYPGVTLGAISLPHGLVLIDAPPLPEDGRAWRAALLSLSNGHEHLLVNLDAHPDRTLGVRAMDCTIVAHEMAAQVFRNRPATFKGQGEETGAEWEMLEGLGNIRWALPEVTFSHQMALYWDEVPVLIEHHPGPSAGASWVILPGVKVAFIGDAVVRNQPPFLASADLPLWIESLKLLLSPAYRGYLIVSGRSGLVPLDVVRTQQEYLKHIMDKLEKLAARRSHPEAFENLVNTFLSGFKIPASRQKQYTQRLHYGLHQYYSHHYHSTENPVEE